MSDTIFVVPAPVGEGELPRIVRHPARSFVILGPEGAEWPREDSFTAARLRDGDVVEAERPAPDADEAEMPETDAGEQAAAVAPADASPTEFRADGPVAAEPRGRRRT